ncbi:MAG: ATP-binding protein [Bacteroidota bacterium]
MRTYNTRYQSLALLVPLLIGISLHATANMDRATTLPTGVIDLRNFDLRDPIGISGQVPLYWNELVSDVNELQQHSAWVVDFPALWQGQQIGDQRLDPRGYGTYYLELWLPQNTAHYSLIIQDLSMAYALYQDGRLVTSAGKVGVSKIEYKPEWQPKTIDLYPTGSDTVRLLLQVSNFHASRGGLAKPIIIGESDAVDRIYTSQLAYELILTGCLVMGGLFFLGLYLFGRHEPAILFFSLFCLVFGYRIIGSGHHALQSLIADFPWWLSIRLEYISLYASVCLFSQFVLNLYPNETSKLVVKVILGGTALFILSTIFLPVYQFTQMLGPYFIALIAAFAYCVWVYVQAWWNKRHGSMYALMSTVVVLLVATYQILDFFQFLDENHALSFWGYILFFFSQSLLLSHRFAYSLKKAKERAEIASEAKTDFLATISHEIRTPLNAIVGMAHLVLRNNPRADQIKNLESLTFSAENLTSLINDILDFNKIESGSLTLEYLPVDLASHATKIIKGYFGESDLKKIDLGLSVDPRLHSQLLVDPVRIAQVLNNLINNALKFTERGRVDLEIAVVQDLPDAQVLEVRVADTGIGIHKEKMEQIFERFTQASSSTTREFGGTGLGLSIVRGILSIYGSQIHVTSQLGEGSTFSFVIKLDKSFETVVSEPEVVEITVDLNVLEGKRVLLVEDNVMNMVIAEEFLSRWGMQLGKATNGEDAIELVQNQEFDLVLMDLHMPIMDGYAASRVIKREFPALPIVALTASTIAEQEQEIRQAGMDGYVLKPFHPKDLQAKLTQVLSEVA